MYKSIYILTNTEKQWKNLVRSAALSWVEISKWRYMARHANFSLHQAFLLFSSRPHWFLWYWSRCFFVKYCVLWFYTRWLTLEWLKCNTVCWFTAFLTKSLLNNDFKFISGRICVWKFKSLDCLNAFMGFLMVIYGFLFISQRATFLHLLNLWNK